jgi:glycosyltransferase involved in cell wall biosynthesis
MGITGVSERPAVLVVTHNFIRNLEDQAGQFIYTLIEPIKDRYRFIVIAPHGPGLPLREEIGGIEVVRFRYADDSDETLAYIGDMHEQVLRSWSKRVLFLRFLRAMRRETAGAIAREKPVAMHIHWWIPGALATAGLASRKRLPYILTTHGSDVTLVRKFSWLKPVARVLFKRASARTSVSSYLQAMLKETLGVDSHVLPMPYDEGKFFPQPPADTNQPVITCIGRFIERKGQKYLLEAGKLLSERGIDFRIQLVGDGPMRAELEKLADKLQIADRVVWAGNVPHAAIPGLIRDSAVVVLPSVLDWKKEAEGLGMVLVEASACGRPVVGTRLGGIMDAIDDGKSGLLVEPCSATALADALAALLTDTQMRTRLGQGGLKFARANFSATGQAEKLAALIDQIRIHS